MARPSGMGPEVISSTPPCESLSGPHDRRASPPSKAAPPGKGSDGYPATGSSLFLLLILPGYMLCVALDDRASQHEPRPPQHGHNDYDDSASDHSSDDGIRSSRSATTPSTVLAREKHRKVKKKRRGLRPPDRGSDYYSVSSACTPSEPASGCGSTRQRRRQPVRLARPHRLQARLTGRQPRQRQRHLAGAVTAAPSHSPAPSPSSPPRVKSPTTAATATSARFAHTANGIT